jgi:hypothetical protein
MKRTMTLSIALLLVFAMLSLMSSDSRAQPSKQKFFFETGIISPGPHESIRLTVNAGAGSDTITVRFMETDYMKGPCSPDGVCKYTVKSENTSAPLMLAPGEGASLDLTCEDPFPAAFARGVVLSNSRNAQVTVQILDTLTGNVVVAFKPSADESTVGQ